MQLARFSSRDTDRFDRSIDPALSFSEEENVGRRERERERERKRERDGEKSAHKRERKERAKDQGGQQRPDL